MRVSVLISQPVLYALSQSANGGVQERIPQVVPTHVGAPFCTAHTAPHAPQLLTSSWVARSHPSLTAALQFANPGLHVIVQVPFRHFGTPLVLSHALPHPPQLARSLEVSTSQPSEAVPLQSTKGVTQEAITHAPVAQLAFAWGRAQAFPHVPHDVVVFRRVSQPSPGSELQSS